MTAADALAGFLRALGVAGPDIPAEEDERAARYRSLLAGKRMLVVLDNAGEVEQVRPLLPGSPSCVVVVTSRDALAGLVAREGATRLDLDLLRHEDAIGLLRALIGERVDADPEAATALAARCCRLPLALRVAAELAAARRGVPLAELAGELADQRRRLDLLDVGGDPRAAVRAVFSWSYRYLDPDAARAFRLAGLHPGADADACAVAALTATSVARGRRLLEVLARAHLVQPAGPGRYGLHDLLRAYAAEQARAIDSAQERHAALTGLFDYYLHAAAGAMDALHAGDKHRRAQPPAPARPIPPPPAPAAARDWLDAERANLVAVTAHAADHGWPGHAVALAGILSRYLRVGGHSPDAEAVSPLPCGPPSEPATWPGRLRRYEISVSSTPGRTITPRRSASSGRRSTSTARSATGSARPRRCTTSASSTGDRAGPGRPLTTTVRPSPCLARSATGSAKAGH